MVIIIIIIIIVISLQSKLQKLDHMICNGGIFDEEELKKILENRGKEAMFRSKVKWFEQGEKSTSTFLI